MDERLEQLAERHRAEWREVMDALSQRHRAERSALRLSIKAEKQQRSKKARDDFAASIAAVRPAAGAKH